MDDACDAFQLAIPRVSHDLMVYVRRLCLIMSARRCQETVLSLASELSSSLVELTSAIVMVAAAVAISFVMDMGIVVVSSVVVVDWPFLSLRHRRRRSRRGSYYAYACRSHRYRHRHRLAGHLLPRHCHRHHVTISEQTMRTRDSLR